MKKVLFLFSDTGGGHRAAAEAIRDALLMRYSGKVAVEMVDVFRSYSPFPFKYMPEMYPWVINRSKTSWGMTFKLTNSRRSARMLAHGMYLSIERGLMRMLQEHPADVVVSVHSILTRPTLRAVRRLDMRPPYVTVVTDLVSTHVFWYDRHTDRCLVPTRYAYEHGLACGLRPDQLRITGLPVHPGFMERLTDKTTARRELGWDQNLPTILAVGGGEGMGPLYETVRAINDRRLRCQLAIIAGRNQPLRQKLESERWNQPAFIYPFVTNMPQLMAASDILVSKAGPATITEACIAGLPVVLYDAIPGQESGNVDLVMEHGAGVYAPTPQQASEVVAGWLAEGPAGLARRSENARRLAHPDAVWDIADEVWQAAHRPRVPGDLQALFHELTRRVPVRTRRY